jgi:hypothetical protein
MYPRHTGHFSSLKIKFAELCADDSIACLPLLTDCFLPENDKHTFVSVRLMKVYQLHVFNGVTQQ